MTVYFAWAIERRQIKIGCTTRPLRLRLSHLEHTDRQTFVFLAVANGAKSEEREWHRRHAASRIRERGGRLGEYFTPSRDLVRDIYDLRTPEVLKALKAARV